MNRGTDISMGVPVSGVLGESLGDGNAVLGLESIVVFGLMLTAVADESPASVYSLPANDDMTGAIQEALGAGGIRLAVRKNGADAI